MSPIQPSKRRRLNTANNTLSQPFKSPFKSPLKQTPASTTSPSSSSPPPPTNKAAPPSSSSSSSSSPSPQTNHNQPRSQPPQSSTPLRNNTRLPTSNNNQYTPRTHHLTTLHSRLSISRAHLDTATQALAIESSNRDLELETLIRKWKGKSREAAEEVFEGVRGRVERMGGVRGLNSREGERNGGWGWGWDERGRGDEEGRVEGERGGRGREDESGDGDEGDERGDDGGEEEKGEEEGAYTMDMMLRSLGIDLAVIGFDRRLQKWVD